MIPPRFSKASGTSFLPDHIRRLLSVLSKAHDSRRYYEVLLRGATMRRYYEVHYKSPSCNIVMPSTKILPQACGGGATEHKSGVLGPRKRALAWGV